MHLDAIVRYPVKSLTGETLDQTALSPGQGIPFDRKWALARPGSDALDDREWHPKSNFYVLARDKSLAKLRTRFDADSYRLHIEAPQGFHSEDVLNTEDGRATIAKAIAQHLHIDTAHAPTLVEARADAYFDTKKGPISLLNMASMRALEGVMGHSVEPLRFRMNLHIEGATPWSERTWLGKRITIGETVLEIAEDTGRCRATHINPQTGEEDLKIMQALKDNFGHTNMGVYGHVLKGGAIAKGDKLSLIP